MKLLMSQFYFVISFFFIPFFIVFILLKTILKVNFIKQGVQYLSKAAFSYKEEDLEYLLLIIYKQKVDIRKYQLQRILISFAFMFAPTLFVGDSLLTKVVVSFFSFFVAYKFLYLLVKTQFAEQLRNINQEMVYVMKTLLMLCYNYPVIIALTKTIPYVQNSLLKESFLLLVEEIDNHPESYLPYQEFINLYHDRIEDLGMFFKMLYRVSQTSSDDSINILNNMNQQISKNLNFVRDEKNKSTNANIEFFGMVPVTIVFIQMMVLFIFTLKF